MAWFNNPSVWVVIIGVLVVIGVMAYNMIPQKQLSIQKPFEPTVTGKVSQISGDAIINFITDMSPDQVRAVAIMSKDVYHRKIGQFSRATELYSLLDERIFPEIWEKVFKSIQDDPASSSDLGGLIVSHYDNKRLEIYTMSAIEEGEPISVADQRFNSKRQAADSILRFYHRLRNYFGDYLVVVISGPNLTDLDEVIEDNVQDIGSHANDGETAVSDINERDNEDFGMYEGALPNWLQHHPSGSSVDRYTRHTKQKIQNVSSLNTAMPPSLSDFIPYNEETRFQTPRHHFPVTNPDFSNHIRTSDSALNVGVNTNKAEPFNIDQEEPAETLIDFTEVTRL